MRIIGQFILVVLLSAAAIAQQAPTAVPVAAATQFQVSPTPSVPDMTGSSLRKGVIAANAMLPGALAALMSGGQCQQIITSGQVSWCMSQCGTNVISFFGGDGVTTTPPPPPVACLPVCYVMGASSQCISWATP